MEKKITRIYTGADGESHFQDINIVLNDEGNPSILTAELIKATGIIFRQTGGDLNNDWHVAPRRQFAINLKGEIEVEIGDGAKRRFGPGDVLLAEDTTGRGHITRAVNNQPREAIFITLD
jgi:hypothetical protein